MISKTLVLFVVVFIMTSIIFTFSSEVLSRFSGQKEKWIEEACRANSRQLSLIQPKGGGLRLTSFLTGQHLYQCYSVLCIEKANVNLKANSFWRREDKLKTKMSSFCFWFRVLNQMQICFSSPQTHVIYKLTKLHRIVLEFWCSDSHSLGSLIKETNESPSFTAPLPAKKPNKQNQWMPLMY